jgi:hypothetical protein
MQRACKVCMLLVAGLVKNLQYYYIFFKNKILPRTYIIFLRLIFYPGNTKIEYFLYWKILFNLLKTVAKSLKSVSNP